jgi:flagellar basal-body rod modification protein FlgD
MATTSNVAPSIVDRPPPDPAAPVTAGSKHLGKDEFVKLLLAQLAHQDPTQPMDSQAFVAQLAQFSQVELMTNSNTDLERLIVGQAAAQQTSVVGLVGKDVVAKSDAVELVDGAPAAIGARLSAPAANVTALVTDGAGKVVRTLRLGAQPAGTLDVPWDGRDENGKQQPPGTYHVSVTAADTTGASVGVESRVRTHVTGITFEDGVPVLLAGSNHIQLSEVVEISERNAP